MKTIKLPHTDLEVSALSLGTTQFGTARSEEESFRQMDIYLEHGGNFIDTALVYGDWGWKEPGRSEQVIGNWLARRGSRNRVVLATKGCHPPFNNMARSRVDAESLQHDVECSLRNLRTDVIDLYFLHRDNPAVPVAELLEALEEEVRKGNLRYYGCSNWSLARVKEAEAYAAAHGLQGFSCNQIMFALTDVVPQTLIRPQLMILDDEFYQYHKEKNLSLMAYMCQSGGYFPKRAAKKALSDSQKEQYALPSNDAILNQLLKYQAEGYAINDFALQYVLQAAFPAIPIGAFGSEQQLLEGIAGIGRPIPEEWMRELIGMKRVQIYRW